MTDSTSRLLAIMARLRDPEAGCPWDLQQTFDSIVPYTIEEAYEVAEAVAEKNYTELKEELGDLLLQVVFQSRIAEEKNLFDFEQVAQGICEKMERRHPHVFSVEAETETSTAKLADIKQNWEIIKAAERAEKGQPRHSVMEGVPRGLPALSRAMKVQKKASKVGFDWQQLAPVFGQVQEELHELQEAIDSQDTAAIEDELGDVFFSLVNMSRHLKLDAESALRKSTLKFETRFREMEKIAEQENRHWKDLGQDDMEQLWRQAKRACKGD